MNLKSNFPNQMIAMLLMTSCSATNDDPEVTVNTTTTTETSSTEATSSSTTTESTSATIKRVVSVVNPFGKHPQNQLVDGDFELSVVSSDYVGGQYGWRAFSASGSSEVGFNAETAGLCHSGLHCAILEPDVILYGVGTASPSSDNIARVFAKVPSSEECDVVTVYALNCETFDLAEKLNASDFSDTDGWCQYTASIQQQISGICLYIQSDLKEDQRAIVDDAFVGPKPDLESVAQAPFWVPSDQLMNRIHNLRDTIVRTRRFGHAPSQQLKQDHFSIKESL